MRVEFGKRAVERGDSASGLVTTGLNPSFTHPEALVQRTHLGPQLVPPRIFRILIGRVDHVRQPPRLARRDQAILGKPQQRPDHAPLLPVLGPPPAHDPRNGAHAAVVPEQVRLELIVALVTHPDGVDRVGAHEAAQEEEAREARGRFGGVGGGAGREGRCGPGDGQGVVLDSCEVG